MTNQRLREQIAALDAGDGGPWEAGYAAAIKDVLALLPADEPPAHRADQWSPEKIQKAMEEPSVPLCPECFRPRLYCACAIKAALNRGAGTK